MATSSTILGVSLDAAGTLIALARPVAETYARIGAAFGIELSPAQVSAAFRARYPLMAPLGFGQRDAVTLRRLEREWWRTLVSQCIGRESQHPRFQDFFESLYEHYRGVDAWRLYPEVGEVLEKLRVMGTPVVVTSNFDSRLLDILDGLGVSGQFVEVVYSTAAGSAKPRREIFDASCRALSLPACQVLHAGDDRRCDLHGARDAGLQARWVRRSIPVTAPMDEIPDLRPVLALVLGRADDRSR